MVDMSRPKRFCEFDGCERQSRAKGLCGGHDMQRRRGQPLRPLRGPSPGGFIDAYGYRIVHAPGHSASGKNGWAREHRKVMADLLGRPLLPGETVHHKNGVRDDNTPSNLELWVSVQPNGQRPEDLLEWADEIIRRYRA